MIYDSMENVDGTSGLDDGLRKSTHFYTMKVRSSLEPSLSIDLKIQQARIRIYLKCIQSIDRGDLNYVNDMILKSINLI